MADPTRSSRFFRAALFFASVWTVATWIFLVDNNLFSQRERFQESDFIMTFYIAGQLVLAGRSNELYPAPEAKSFIDSPFDKAAHEFLPHLPKHSIGAYMYTPLVAGFFAPLSLAGPNYSLLIWQLLSGLALAFSCWLLGRASSAHSSELFFFAHLYLPVFLTLWAGQLGLVFGVAPLCVGYFLLLRGWPFVAGLAWSLLLLKPQYFLAAAFVALVLVLVGRYRTLAGMAAGVLALLGFTAIVFSPALTLHWLQSHQVSDSIFSAGLHGIPSHLITGLPANLMILFPSEMRAVVKSPLYFGAALLWLVGFAFASKLVRAKLAEVTTIPLILVLGLVLCSLTLPHLLYYDLCVLLPAGILLLANNGAALKQFVARDLTLAGWIAVSGFLPLLLLLAAWKIVPLALELILLSLFFILLARLKSLWRSADCTTPMHLTS